MEITKELLEKRRTQLQADYEQAIKMAQAFGGAIQDCEYWLEQLSKEPEPVVAEEVE